MAGDVVTVMNVKDEVVPAQVGLIITSRVLIVPLFRHRCAWWVCQMFECCVACLPQFRELSQDLNAWEAIPSIVLQRGRDH